ncbi:MAG: hydroxymethylglutaryl-CoA lyase [Burkholderiaceae bacterium]|nr:hydroxymethylglutaryl-CoA lyase [Burkholderiaceae bacterium]
MSLCAGRVDLEKLIAARVPLQVGLPGEPIYGMTPDAGLPKGFAQRVKGVSHA